MSVKGVVALQKILQPGRSYPCRQYEIVPSQKLNSTEYRVWFTNNLWIPVYYHLHDIHTLKGYDPERFANAAVHEGWQNYQPCTLESMTDQFFKGYFAKHDGTDRLGHGIWLVPEDEVSMKTVNDIGCLLMSFAYKLKAKQFSVKTVPIVHT